MIVKADRYRQLSSFCIVLGADADLTGLVGSLLDAHPAAQIARELDVLNGKSLRSQGRVEFLDRVAVEASGGSNPPELVGLTEGRNTMRTLHRRPRRLHELADLLGVPVRVVSALRDPFHDAASTGGSGERSVWLRQLRTRLKTLRRIGDDGVKIVYVRREELVDDATGELERLCSSLGLEPSPDYLNSCRRAVASESGLARHERKLGAKEVRQINLLIDRFPILDVYRRSGSSVASTRNARSDGQHDPADRPGKAARPPRSRQRRERGGESRDQQLMPSGLTEYLFDPAGQTDAPVLLFHHIQKTAGTSLREMIRANLPQAEREVRRHGHHRPRDELLSAFQQDFEDLPDERRAALRCVMSHRANFALPFIDGPVHAITVVREPVDRVISHHYFVEKTKAKRRGDRGRTPRTIDSVYAEFGYEAERAKKAAFIHHNFQARSLLAPFHDPADLPRSRGPSPDAELWRERLFTIVSERYAAGVQDRLEDFGRLIAARFGWRETDVGHRKPSPVKEARRNPTVPELPEIVLEEIRAYNWLDLELYDRVAAEFGKETSDLATKSEQ